MMLDLYALHSEPSTLHGHDKKETYSPRHAYRAAFKRHERFPEGEAAIAKSAFYSFSYAQDVLQDAFPAGEAAIANDPEEDWATMYIELLDFDETKLTNQKLIKRLTKMGMI